jgi:hypothetical protein
MTLSTSHRCGWLAAIFALGLTGCSDLLEGDLAAALVQLGASTEDNFRKSRSVSVTVEPADLALYRELLPEVFAMPEHPLVTINVVDQLEVGPWPLTPYQLASVSLRCVYEGEEGWHPITMPETKWVAVWTGRTMGFPKYVADEIHLSPEGEGWLGEVRHAGELRLRLAFTPAANAPVPRWKRARWSTGGPTFNLRPPSRGPEVKIVRTAEGAADSSEVERRRVRMCERVTRRRVSSSCGREAGASHRRTGNERQRENPDRPLPRDSRSCAPHGAGVQRRVHHPNRALLHG